MKTLILLLMIALGIAKIPEKEIIVEDTELQEEVIATATPTNNPVVEEKIELSDFRSEAHENMLDEIDMLSNYEDEEEWFIAYKNIQYKYAKWIDPPKTVFDAFSEDEVMLIMRTVETEVYDRDFMSKANVASVIFNRYNDPDKQFGETMTEVETNQTYGMYLNIIHGINNSRMKRDMPFINN